MIKSANYPAKGEWRSRSSLRSQPRRVTRSGASVAAASGRIQDGVALRAKRLDRRTDETAARVVARCFGFGPACAAVVGAVVGAGEMNVVVFDAGDCTIAGGTVAAT